MLEKCLERGWRALVRAGTPDRLDTLDAHLWTFRDDSFVAHGREGAEKVDAARQPVLLTDKPGNPNAAKALFLIDGAEADDIANFERACLIFDGRDPAALESARSRWKEAKAAGLTASYWRESASGKWEKQA